MLEWIKGLPWSGTLEWIKVFVPAGATVWVAWLATGPWRKEYEKRLAALEEREASASALLAQLASARVQALSNARYKLEKLAHDVHEASLEFCEPEDGRELWARVTRNLRSSCALMVQEYSQALDHDEKLLVTIQAAHASVDRCWLRTKSEQDEAGDEAHWTVIELANLITSVDAAWTQRGRAPKRCG